jgi:hypothetical protein
MEMAFLRWSEFGVMVLLATAVSPAQQRFPLRSGEWASTLTSTTAGEEPTVLLYCLNDELWTKALMQDPLCTVTQLSVTSSGATYNMDCKMKVMQMKGKVEMNFDGMEHMTAKGFINLTLNGKTTSSVTYADYRWKGGSCSPRDLNLRPKTAN